MNDTVVNGGNVQQSVEEQEIDLLELAKKVWDSRMLVLKVCGIGAVIGLVVAFSIPKEYTAEILIAPESSGKKSVSSGMGALAAMAGVNIGSSSGSDAIYPDLYPDIVSSMPFLIDLFDMEVHEQKDSTAMTLATYMKDHQKAPWWSSVVGAPFKLVGWTMSLFRDEEEEKGDKIDPFCLTPEQKQIVDGIGSNIMITVDKKTMVITLAVTMQDPLIAAVVADSVRTKLQEYVTDYRTSKARTTLEFTEKLTREAREEYYEAQAKYTRFADTNQGLAMQSSRAELEKLQNEMNLAYNAYNQMSQQLRAAKADVEEVTPVYTIIQPASVPLRPSKPNKMMVLVGFIFLAAVGSVGWILFVDDLLKNMKEQLAGNKQKAEV